NCTTTGDKECSEETKPADATGCTCNKSTGEWENCTTTGDKECSEETKPADATGCTCNKSTGEWENCTTTGDKECSEETKPADATGCTCNKSTGEWENCTITGDKECSEETKPANATGCTCNKSTGEWENCTTTGDSKECPESAKPAGATGCTCNKSTGEWENCTTTGDKECSEETKPADATGCTCNKSTGEWENCTTTGDKECSEETKPADATGCTCNKSTGEWENCTEIDKKCEEADKPAGAESCECVKGEWQCTYPKLSLVADTQGFYVSESGEKADIEVSLSSCPVMPTTVTATTDKPEECGIYSEEGKSIVTSVDLLFNSEDCGTAQKVTVIGIDDKVEDGDAHCKLILTASSKDTNVNTSYNGMKLEVEGINEDNDTAKINFKANKTTIIEAAKDGSDSSILHVMIATKPMSNVTINLMPTNVDTSDTFDHLTLSVNQLIFTPDNYNKPQDIKFTAVRDYIATDDIDVKITGTASSTDPKYDKMTQSTNIKVTNVDTIGVDIKASGTVLYESKSTQSQTVTVKLKSKPTHDVTVKLTRENDRIRVAPSNSSILASNKATQTIKPDEWDTGKTFYVFPNDDTTRNTNNIANLEVATDSDDYAYFGYFLKTPDFRVIDDESITNGKLNVSCSGTAGCTSVQGFAKCTFSLDTNNRPADKTDVRITCTSPDTVIWVHDATLTNSGNYSISDVDAGGGKCGAAMEGDRFGTSTITCTATSSTGFKATGSTSLKYSYHHLEWP
ncbi:MAG: hypothetical protein IJM59_09155, partial [Proteobacteria bacterium]|nr:hypothetical protein [Pseudomonadota bacterium]